jgi:glycosyltransferase involved in cell wall biosynthesis
MKKTLGIKVSVIMPTLNSSRTIEMSLKSIRDQEFNQREIEILVIDGGSVDNTREIAKRYNAKVIENPNVVMEWAKFEGIKSAKGKYLIFLDSDEVLGSPLSISDRIRLMEKNNLNILITGGYKRPKGTDNINDYINIFSDPFAHFFYGVVSDYRYFFISLNKKYKLINDTEEYGNFSYDGRLLPIFDVCAGITINRKYLNRIKSQLSVLDVPLIFHLVTREQKVFSVLKNDYILHYSSDSILRFLKKLKWRVVANIFYSQKTATGFSNKEGYLSKKFKNKKYFFILYNALILPVTLDSILMSLKYRNPYLLINIPFSLYTCFLIIYYYFLKFIRIKPNLPIYG